MIPTLKNTRLAGTRIEKSVAKHLLKKGSFRLLETQFTTRHGEIDLILEEDTPRASVLVFLEVRSNQTGSDIEPFESVDHEKQKRIKHTSRLYLEFHYQGRATEIRYDVASVKGKLLTYLKDAF